MLSRRDFTKTALAAFPVSAMAATVAAKIDSVVSGVHIGLQTYAFTVAGLPQEGILDVIVKSMAESGLGECDLFGSLTDPAEFTDRIRAGSGRGAVVSPEAAAAAARARQDLAEWRKSVSLDYYRAIRKKFEDAGIEIHGISGFPGSTEEELGRTFDIAETLGARLITLGFALSAGKRVAPFVEKRNVMVGIQGRPDMTVTNPDVIAKPENYEEALSFSKNYSVSLDIGDATGGGWDVLKFVETHHGRIGLLYLKDRRKDKLSVPWGQGDTPLTELLHMIRDKKYPIRCYLDCDYKTTDRPADVQASFKFVKAALAS